MMTSRRNLSLKKYFVVVAAINGTGPHSCKDGKVIMASEFLLKSDKYSQAFH